MDAKPKVDIFVDPDVREELVMFLVTDWMGTGQGYSDFIRKSIQLWRTPVSAEDTDNCTWRYNFDSKGWESGCGHKQYKRPTNVYCPYCVKPLVIHSLSARQWSKEYDEDNKEKGQNGRED